MNEHVDQTVQEDLAIPAFLARVETQPAGEDRDGAVLDGGEVVLTGEFIQDEGEEVVS